MLTPKDAIDELLRVLENINHMEEPLRVTKRTVNAITLAIDALKYNRWITDSSEFPDDYSRTVGLFKGGEWDQLSWFDLVDTWIDGTPVPMHQDPYINNVHLVAVLKLPYLSNEIKEDRSDE